MYYLSKVQDRVYKKELKKPSQITGKLFSETVFALKMIVSRCLISKYKRRIIGFSYVDYTSLHSIYSGKFLFPGLSAGKSVLTPAQ